MEYSKSSSKRGVYSNTTLPQDTRKINNLNTHKQPKNKQLNLMQKQLLKEQQKHKVSRKKKS